MTNERRKTTLVIDGDERPIMRKLAGVSRALSGVGGAARMAFGMKGRGINTGRDISSGRFQRRGQNVAGAGARGAAGAMGLGVMAGGGMGATIAPGMAVLGGGANAMRAMGSNMRAPTQPWHSKRNLASSGMSGVGGMLGLAGGAIALGAKMAFQRRTQLASVNRQFGMARLYGHEGGLSRGGGSRMGMMPGEYAGQMASFSQARGFLGDENKGLGLSPAAMMRTGVSGGALGGFAGMFGPGGGAKGGTAVMALEQAVAQGVRGAGLDRWLSTIATYTGQIAQQGGTVDVGSVNRLTGRMQNTKGLKGLGSMQPQFMAKGMGAVSRARQSTLGGLGGINDALATQKAAQLASKMPGGATPQNLARAFDMMQNDPNMAFSAFQGGQGELGFIGQGLSADVSRGLSNLSGSQASTPLLTGELPKGFAGSRALAGHESKMMGAASGIELKKILDINYAIQSKLMKSAEVTAKAATKIAGWGEKLVRQMMGH